MNKAYVHGYDHRENLRLQDQASTLVELLHSDTSYPPGSRVLEAGCGVGAQTVTLARNSPMALIISVDISETSLTEARKKGAAAGLTNVQFEQADIFNLPYGKKTFTAMTEGIRESAIKAGMIEPQVFEQGIRDLYRTAEADGVFCYTFFKAVGNK